MLFFQLSRLQPLFHLYRMDFDVPAQLDRVPQLFQLRGAYADLRGLGFIAVELLALLYQRGDFIFCFLPDGGKLPAVRDVIFENEFRLLDSSIQLADILTHSVTYVPWLFRQRAHLV